MILCTRSSGKLWGLLAVLGIVAMASLGCGGAGEPAGEGPPPAGEGGDTPASSLDPGASGDVPVGGGADANIGGAAPDAGTSPDVGTSPDPVTSPDVEEPSEEVVPGLPGNDAEFVSQNIPLVVTAGETFEAALTFRNTGENAWSKGDLYFLGSENPQDNFVWSTNRMTMNEDAVIQSMDTYTFTKALTAPLAPGVYDFQWRMLQDAVEWFGAVSQNLLVEVLEASDPETEGGEGPGDDSPPFTFDEVIWLHKDVSGWEVTATLSSVGFQGDKICLEYDKKNVWPVHPPEPSPADEHVVANPWVFAKYEGQWYAATWEWMRPGQTCKSADSVAGGAIKKAPLDANSGWTPTSGQELYFMVSGLARIPGIVNVSERSNLVKVVWP